MSSFTIDSLARNDRGFEARVSAAGLEHTLSFRVNRSVSPAFGNALLCATLLPAMASHASVLHIPDAISPTLAHNIDRLQSIFSAWAPELSPLRVEPETLATEVPIRSRVASFFSGGVDSFYTVLRNLDRIDTLVFLRGFDIAPSQARLAAVATDQARAIAAELGKDLIEVDISVRPFADRLVPWLIYHGSLLAAVAHLLDGIADQVLVPATFAITDGLEPLGSHPLTDPLWGSATVRLVHEGAEVNRAEKIRYLIGSDIAMRNLRVCWQNPDEGYNCGRCQKCLLTMVALRAAGGLGRCMTLPDEIDPTALKNITIREGPFQFIDLMFIDYCLRALAQAQPPAPTLEAPLGCVVGNYRRRQAEAYLGPLVPAFSGVGTDRPAGYRIVDNVYRKLGRLPRVRTTARRVIRKLADRADWS